MKLSEAKTQAAADAHRFLTAVPALVASIPPQLPITDRDDDWGRRANEARVLRLETQELAQCFTNECADYDLTRGEFDRAADTLRQVCDTIETLRHTFVLAAGENTALTPSESNQYLSNTVSQRHHVAKLQHCNNTLRDVFEELLNGPEQPVTDIFQSSAQPKRSAAITPDDRELRRCDRVRDSARALTHLVTSAVQPCQPPHTAMLHLSGFCDDDEEDEERHEINTIVSLCDGRSEELRWHHVQWLGVTAAEGEQQLEYNKSLCRDLKEFRKNKTRLRVQLGRDRSWRHGENLSSCRSILNATKPEKSLYEVLFPHLEKTQAEAGKEPPIELYKKDRMQLADVMARSLLRLLGSPLLQCPWRSNAIFIILTGDGDGGGGSGTPALTKLKLYTPCQLTMDAIQPGPPGQLWRPKAFVLHFGVILWQLFYGQEVEVTAHDRGENDSGSDSEEEDEDEDKDAHAKTKEERALYLALSRHESEMKKLCYDVGSLAIIQSCLDLCGPSMKEDEKSFRVNMYQRMVKPLSLAANPQGHKPPLEPSRAATPLLKPIIGIAPPSPPPPSYESPIRPTLPASFLATEGTRSTATLKVTNSASWMTKFDDIKKYIDGLHGRTTPEPVRVAILDTGCDIKHQFFVMEGAKKVPGLEKHWLDLVDKRPEPVDEDHSKHGTALAMLLVRLLPKNSELHVIRVARNSGSADTGKADRDLTEANFKKAVAIAIRLAVEERKAGLVSMSFGFDVEVSDIKDAISAVGDRAVFFAAANNHGMNQDEMFPAFAETVISVRGTEPSGQFHSFYNPSPKLHKADARLYGTLGCDVECGGMKGGLAKSGCSVATPIMVAIAATLISFVDSYCSQQPQQLRSLDRQRIRTTRGVLAAFRELTKNQGTAERLYVAPWHLFHNLHHQHSLDDAKSRIQGALATLPRIE